MSDLKLRCYRPHPKQVEFLSLAKERHDGIMVAHAVAGAGGGKTIAGVLWMLEACLTYNKGFPHLWTAPTYRMAVNVMLSTWRQIVPPELYTYVASDQRIDVEGGGSVWLRSRDNPNSLRGLTVAGALSDELAMDPTSEGWRLIRDRIRPSIGKRPGQMFHLSISTPKPGWYNTMIRQSDHPMVHWTSFDNPYDDETRLQQSKEEHDDFWFRREIMAELVSEEGRIWRGFDDAPFPSGNRIDYSFDPTRPWFLACDLGVKSAWMAIQKVDLGYQEGLCDVVVGEWTPDDEGAQQTIGHIAEWAGTAPQIVAVGRDVNTRSVTDAKASTYFFRNRWGNVRLAYPQGDTADKMLQHDITSGRIQNSLGQRRLLVSNNLQSHFKGRHNKRGILQVMLEDTWSDNPSRGEYLPKDKGSGIGYEDMRDALLYWCATQYPPRMTKNSRFAA